MRGVTRLATLVAGHTTKSRRVRMVMGCLAGAVAVSADCCNRSASINLTVGNMPDENRAAPVTDVWVCPGHDVTVAWGADHGFTSAQIPQLGPGDVRLPSSFKVDQPTTTTEYKLHVSDNSCSMDRSATAHVVQEGDLATLALSLVHVVNEQGNTLQGYWQTTADPTVWDPQISVTSIVMQPFPPTQPDAAIWNAPVPWQWKKTDQNGTVHLAPVGWSTTTPWGTAKIPMVGLHQLSVGSGSTYPNNSIPQFANITFTLSCK